MVLISTCVPCVCSVLMFRFSLFSGLAEEKPDFTYHVIETLLPNAAYKEDAGRGKLLELYVGNAPLPHLYISILVTVFHISIYIQIHNVVTTTHSPVRTDLLSKTNEFTKKSETCLFF